MEKLTELLRGIARYVELEELLPELRLKRDEAKDTLKQKELEAAQRKYEADQWESPGFFRRLMGNTAEKHEAALMKLRTARADRDAAKQALAELDERLKADTAEFESLANCLEDYTRAKQAFLATATPEDAAQLRALELERLRPVALIRLRQLRETLEALRPGMRRDIFTTLDGLYGKKFTLLELADLRAEQFRAILAHLPAEDITLGASLTCPSDYIRSVTNDTAQLDRANFVIEQCYRVRGQIREL